MDYVDLSAHQAHSGNRRRTRVSHSGNRTSMVETPASGPAVTWAYAYDWLDRLTSVTKDSVLQSVYSYDESDHRIQLQMPVLGQTHSYAYDFADRIVSRSVGGSVVETFSHDADGNLIARTAGGVTTNYTWNDDNRLVAVAKSRSTTQYRYDSEGIRKSKGSDTRDFSSGAISLADLHPTNSISYVQGHQILGMIQASQFYWYISDALSTVRLVVDGSGAVVASYASDEFGNQTAATGSADLRQHTYTGGLGVRDDGAALGLLYARQRYYDPSVGRWLNVDPIGFAGGLNLTNYAGNNSLNFNDPIGLQPQGAGATLTRPFQLPPFPAIPLPAILEIEVPPVADTVVVVGGGGAILVTGAGALQAQWQAVTAEGAYQATLAAQALQMAKKKAKQSEKEKASDGPSWMRGETPQPGNSAGDAATRLPNDKYGTKKYIKGAGHEFKKSRNSSKKANAYALRFFLQGKIKFFVSFTRTRIHRE